MQGGFGKWKNKSGMTRATVWYLAWPVTVAYRVMNEITQG